MFGIRRRTGSRGRVVLDDRADVLPRVGGVSRGARPGVRDLPAGVAPRRGDRLLTGRVAVVTELPRRGSRPVIPSSRSAAGASSGTGTSTPMMTTRQNGPSHRKSRGWCGPVRRGGGSPPTRGHYATHGSLGHAPAEA